MTPEGCLCRLVGHHIALVTPTGDLGLLSQMLPCSQRSRYRRGDNTLWISRFKAELFQYELVMKPRSVSILHKLHNRQLCGRVAETVRPNAPAGDQ